MAALHKIFVYGTLKRNQRNHYLMTDERNGRAVFLGEGKLINPHPLVVRRSEYVHPVLLPQNSTNSSNNVVYGELYEVDSPMLEVLDRFERHPTWYIRTQTQCILTISDVVSLSEDNVIDCEVYIYKDPEPELYSLSYISCYDDSMC